MRSHWAIGVVGHFGANPNKLLLQAVLEAEGATSSSEGTYFLISPDLRVDPYLSRVLQMSKFRLLSPATQDSYIKDIRAFFDFLLLKRKSWRQAQLSDVDDWEYWRTESPENPKHIGPSKWMREYSAILKIYSLAGRIGASSLAGELRLSRQGVDELPSRSPQRAAKWLPPAVLRQWRDVGLRGLGWEGDEDAGARHRMSDRNSAFADLLLGTGLRSAEAHALSVLEIPEESVTGGQVAVLLCAGLAKGRVNERLFYLDHPTLSAVRTYMSLSRTEAIRRAHARKTYEKIPGKLIVTAASESRDPMLKYAGAHGFLGKKRLSKFSPLERQNLFDGTGSDLVPIALWLSQDGTPMSLRAWQGVFKTANERCQSKAPSKQQAIYCHPHMLRHTFAMVKLLQFRMVLDRRYGLSVSDRRDNEMKYGPAYDAVRDLLGHASSVTTRKVYLAPLRDLEVQMLLREVGQIGEPDPFHDPDDIVVQLMTGV